MSTTQVNALFAQPFGNVEFSTLPIAREYWTGEVRYFWAPIKNVDDFRNIHDLGASCLNQMDYAVFFHSNSLFRISYRLYGLPESGCADRRQLFPVLAKRYRIPLLGPPKSWRLSWEAGHVSIIGTTVSEGPMLDIIAK